MLVVCPCSSRAPADCFPPRVACPLLPDTGPLYVKYNLLLRSKSGVDIFTKRCEAACKDNGYVTTLHSINSAVVKLGKLTRPTRVYRGISGGRMPKAFTTVSASGIRGGIENAFTSTTKERDVAMGRPLPLPFPTPGFSSTLDSASHTHSFLSAHSLRLDIRLQSLLRPGLRSAP